MHTLNVPIEKVVKIFADRNPAVFVPGRCRDRCDYFSTVFMDLVHEVTDLPARLVSGFQFTQFDGHKVILEGHVATLVGDTIYDWTARQFDPKAEVPTIQPLTEWRETWEAMR